jgi:transglutaminase-like putative cysteine protease
MTELHHRILAAAIFFSLGWNLAFSARAAEPKPVSFDIAATPQWVRPIVPVATAAMDADNGGITYLLVDQQEHVEPRASFYHEARQITSENGAQTGSAISASFDPSFQKLTYHFIRLIRDGVPAERLDRSQIKLLQREKDMESFLFDGSFTAHCQLEDVRVGDIIEFAYTTEGANPVKKGKFSTTLPTDWYYPVRRAVTRFVYPAQRKLNFRPVNRAIKPSIATDHGMTEWLWQEADVPARKPEANIPPDYDPCGWIQASEFVSWEQVVDWGVSLYQTNDPISGDLQKKIDELRAIKDIEQRILAALRFVQDEIRYLGIESGMGSHQPSAPSEVLRRRFGDCKDKARLLGTLLRQTGVDATPALVSDAYRGRVADRLPSTGAFDHVILHVRSGAATYWLDATRSNQRGPLSQIYVTDFGYALILRPGTKTLTAMAPPPGALPRKKIIESYRIPAPEGTGGLEVISEFHGLSADRIRSYFQENGRERIQKDYLQYYTRRFPAIHTAQALQYEELPGENACKVKEFYSIPKVWQINEEKMRYEVSLYPAEVDHDMGSPGPSQRDDPLALDAPVNTTQEINAEMFEDWPVDTPDHDVSNAFYHFRDETKANGRHLQFTYSYENRADRVSVGDLPAYNTELSKLRDTLGYTISYSTPAQLAAWRQKRTALNWPIASLFGAVLAAATFASVWYFRRSRLAEPLPQQTLPSKEGIGGWLILVAIHHFVRPIGFVAALLALFPTVFNLEVWRPLTEPGHPQFHWYWAPVLLFELFYNSLGLVACGLLLALFFMKRAVWPRCYVLFLIAILVGLSLDTYFAQQIPGAKDSLIANIRGLAQVIGAAAIWIPYCFVSKRVRATFRY